SEAGLPARGSSWRVRERRLRPSVRKRPLAKRVRRTIPDNATEASLRRGRKARRHAGARARATQSGATRDHGAGKRRAFLRGGGGRRDGRGMVRIYLLPDNGISGRQVEV